MRTAAVRSKRRSNSSVRAKTAIAPHKKIGMKVAFAPDSANKASTSATATTISSIAGSSQETDR